QRGTPISARDSSRFFPPEIEELLERFEVAWRGGTTPDLQAFLPDALPDGRPLSASVREGLLCELVKLDLEHRWRGAPVPAPSPAAASPTRPTHPGGAHRLPAPPLLDDYVACFPELAPPGPPRL